MELLATFGAAFIGCIIGIGIYNWVKAERDARQWERIWSEESSATSYRLVAIDDKDSDRE